MTLRRLSPTASVQLDAVRGVAALLVAAGHVRSLFLTSWTSLDAGWHTPALAIFYSLTALGHQAVVVFFVLSGFLVGGAAIRAAQTGRWSTADYVVARTSRLYTVVVPALALTLAADTVTHALPGGAAWFTQPIAFFSDTPIAERSDWLTLLGNLVFLQTITVPAFGSNMALWSLANEFWYYVAFPPLMLALSSLGLTRRLVWAGGALALWLVLPAFLLVGFAVWLLGAGVAVLSARRQVGTGWRLATGLLLAVTVGAGLLNRIPPAIADPVLGVAFSAWLLTLAARVDAEAPAGPVVAAVRGLASFSFSLYAVHLPLAMLLRVWWGRPAAVPDLAGIGLVLAVLSIVVLCAWMFWFAIEARTPAVRRRLLALLSPAGVPTLAQEAR